jgi:hypothetical protein
VAAINALGFNEKPARGYPSRCQRIGEAIRGYDAAANDYNQRGANMPLYDVCGCTAVVPGGGLYARGPIAAKATLTMFNTMRCGTPKHTADVPRTISRDVDGMCAVFDMSQGDRLTWNNIGVCSLMH